GPLNSTAEAQCSDAPRLGSECATAARRQLQNALPRWLERSVNQIDVNVKGVRRMDSSAGANRFRFNGLVTPTVPSQPGSHPVRVPHFGLCTRTYRSRYV